MTCSSIRQGWYWGWLSVATMRSRRAAQEQRQLPIRVRVFGQVVVEADGVLSLVEEVLAHRTARERRHPFDRRGFLRGGGDDDRVLHRAFIAQPLVDLRNRRSLLPDRNVDADHVGVALV